MDVEQRLLNNNNSIIWKKKEMNNVMLKEIIIMILPLIGVLLGGVITFYAQQWSLKKTQNFEREKIEQDKQQFNENLKFKAYNTILINSGTYQIHLYDKETNGELDYEKYVKYVRPVLFEVFHLLDPEIRQELINIEYIYEGKPFKKGEEAESDKKKLRTHYVKIIQHIIAKYEEYNKKENNPDVVVQP